LRFVIAFNGVFQPRLAALAGQQNDEVFGRMVTRYSILVSNLSACGGVLAFLLCGDFLMIWVPRNFGHTQVVAAIFTILLIGLIPELTMGVFLNALLAVEKHRYYAYQTLAEGVATIVVSIILVKLFGVYGAAWGVVLPVLVTRLIIQPFYCCRIFHIRWSRYIVGVLLKPLLVVTGVVVFFRITGIMSEVSSYAKLFLKGGLISALYLGVSFFFCVNRLDRQTLLPDFVKRAFGAKT
jgi:O-antigen/teichoic acid export membrane protein